MAQGGGYSVQAFLEAADSGSDVNSVDGESQDTVGFDAKGGSRALEISSAHAQLAALESQNAKLQRDNDEAETQAAAAKLKVMLEIHLRIGVAAVCQHRKQHHCLRGFARKAKGMRAGSGGNRRRN